MKIANCALPVLGLTAILVLLPERPSQGFSLIGGSLSLSQRDVRIFNNFTDAQANDNTSTNVNFPGADGAELAIWKAVIEWGSSLHGDGQGDPTQPFGLGSGGANFDVSWQGNATAIGTTDNNIHSEISGSDGGVLAFCETPINNGWRIRYYQGWTWFDDVSSSHGGIDLQGVACHEYGHALGLGHSGSGGATMLPSISGNGSGQRSIEADDRAGVQAVYGIKSASKPGVLTYSLAGGNVTITGTNYSATNNEVWFTKTGTGGDGTPVKVTGVTSDGTSITVAIPVGAGPGDVLVRNNGTGHANLSNAFPFDPLNEPPPPPQPPTITSVSPNSVQAFGPGFVVLGGTDMSDVVSVQVGATLLTEPAGFTILNDTTLQFAAPAPSALGPVSIVLNTALQSSLPAALTYVETSPPQLSVSAFAFSSLPFVWTMGAGTNDLAIVAVSTSSTTVPLFGFPVLASPIIVANKLLGPLGISSAQVPAVPAGLVGLVFQSQIATLDLPSGAFSGASALAPSQIIF
jgi:hypothetical protein